MIDFDKLINRFLFRETKPKEIGRYYPSEIGQCLRKVFYTYKYPKELSPESIKFFELGNILHDFVVKVLRSEKNPEIELLKHEFPLRISVDDFVIAGRVDDLLLIRESGRSILVEVKSCRDASAIKEPKQHHKMQLQFYMHATGIRNGILLYIGKNDLSTKAFEIEFDEDMCREIIERFRILHQCLKNGKLPIAEAKQFPDMSWMCSYCEYKEKCDRSEV
ncbi:MAG: Dna2/Cas4 domain-containing protein [Candidatus Micrarchaeota archaeon]|nr:Dna2/Cas4 domain-containing protein [Candidatus Micrarchaeota archaeon]